MASEIPKANEFVEKVFILSNEKSFNEIALALFRYQYHHNKVYQSFCKLVERTPANVTGVEALPFLPIEFFKNYEVKTDDFEPQQIFKSSGTTGSVTSKHLVKDVSLYEKSFLACFEKFYGKPQQYCILGLLPSYLEQGSSSLVYMVNSLIEISNHPLSGFYLYDFERLKETILRLENMQQPTILFGVTYALLDFAKSFPLPLQYTTIIETGGMKGRKKEVSKAELYEQLKQAFSLSEIHAEYGMTELLSQGYAVNGFYRTPPWMKIVLRDETDPFALGVQSGAVNVIDLANIYSCCFIATDDLGRLHNDGSFEVLGRMDNSDVRGCSQLVL